MFLIRAAFWIAVIVMLLPTDKAGQERLVQHATQAAHWTMTFCDRNPQSCAQAGQVWETFQTKAHFGLEMASELIRERSGGAPATVLPAALSTPVAEPIAPQPIGAAPRAPTIEHLERPVKRQDRLPLYRDERARWDG